ncbi:Transmembrane protein 53 [Porphyridium purpureum]|uniref:Transmembrane protein 53 n=1 Tax=Porphyridium purpureum TaxID=35688 RepID=A0A5J4Z4S6_PORPP|nr:Transmembrane protein 53 [Porphyridium purpureum]|eukprot:POR5293..scf295_1
MRICYTTRSRCAWLRRRERPHKAAKQNDKAHRVAIERRASNEQRHTRGGAVKIFRRSVWTACGAKRLRRWVFSGGWASERAFHDVKVQACVSETAEVKRSSTGWLRLWGKANMAMAGFVTLGSVNVKRSQGWPHGGGRSASFASTSTTAAVAHVPVRAPVRVVLPDHAYARLDIVLPSLDVGGGTGGLGGNGGSHSGGGNGGGDSNDGSESHGGGPATPAATLAVLGLLQQKKKLAALLGSVVLVTLGGFMMSKNMNSLVASVADDQFIDSDKPLVVMLSWMGARKKHLDRYREYYTGLGYEVVCYMNSMGTALVPSMSEEQAARVQLLLERQPEDRKVIVHAFSIGTGIYGLMLNRIKHDAEKLNKLNKNIVGVIFDSGPCHIFPRDVAKGLHTVFPIVSRTLWRGVADSLFWLTKARRSFSQAEAALAQFQLPAPQLYFSSKDDRVAPKLQESVNYFVENNKKRGVQIQNIVFESSRHAARIILHPEEYIHNLNLFLEQCMNKDSEAAVPKPAAST